MNRLLPYSILAWLLFLFFQSGNWLDEAEHCNAAWQMGVLGLHPYSDFFQHHTPLLWDLLALFFRLGGSGVEVLFFGRLIVVLCGVACLYSFFALTRSDGETGNRGVRLALPLFVFAAFTIALSSTFVIRPETPALALGALSFAVWRKKGLPFSAAAGLLWGLGVYSSPRLVSVAPLFCFFAPEGSRDQRLKSGAVLFAGSLAAFAIYSFISGHSFSDYAYALSFSRHFQTIGEISGYFAMKMGNSPPLYGPVLLTGLIFGGFLSFSEGAVRRRIALHAGVFLAIVALSIFLSWPHSYPQNLMPGYFYVPFALVDMLNHRPVANSHANRNLTTFSAVWLILAATLALFSDYAAKADLLRSYRLRKDLLAGLAAGEKVILPYMVHPIAVANASFYGGYQDDGINRNCRAALTFKGRALPPCDYVKDLVEKLPALIEATTLPIAAEPDNQPVVRALIEKYYRLHSTMKQPKAYAFFRLKDQYRKTPVPKAH